MAETASRTVTIAKRPFQLDRRRIEKAMRNVLGEPISSHYVVVGSRRYPPKQVIALVTGVDRADFTSHQARRILMGLGFAAGRRSGSATRAATGRARAVEPGSGEELVETLRSLRGEWVAIKDNELLVAASTPQELVRWLARHRRKADSMFRVPEDELAMGGLAPL
jgi:hypothetical protein